MINVSPYNGSGSLTREQFLFYEMRTTAKLMTEGLPNEEIVARISCDNLFQYPTEKSVKSIANACIARLEAMDNDSLIQAIANQSSEVLYNIPLLRFGTNGSGEIEQIATALDSYAMTMQERV